MAGAKTQLAVVATVVDDATAKLKKIGGSVKNLAKDEAAAADKTAKASKKVTDAKNRMSGAMSKQIPIVGRLTTLMSGPAGLAIAAGAVAAAVGKMTSDVISTGTEIAKASKKFGIGIEALQELRKAADDEGVAIAQLDVAMRSLGRRAADAANGNREFGKGFDALGVDVLDANGKLKSTEVLLGDVADGMAGLSTAGERTSAAMRTMGDGGAAMLPMLLDGADGLDKMRQKARNLGGVLSVDMVKSAERTSQAMADMSFAVKGLSNTIGATLMPVLETAATAWLNWLKPDAFMRASKNIQRLEGEIEDTQAMLNKWGADTNYGQQFAAELDLLVSELKGAEAKIKSLKVEFNKPVAGDAGAGSGESPRIKNARDTSEKVIDIAKEERRKRVAEFTAMLKEQKKIEKGQQAARLETNKFFQQNMLMVNEMRFQKELDAFDEAEKSKEAIALEASEKIRQGLERTRQVAMSATRELGNMMGQVVTGAVTAKKALDILVKLVIKLGIQAAAFSLGGPFAAAFAGGVASGFAKGGIVTGGIKGKDSVPAVLTPGELVIPEPLVSGLQKLIGAQGGRRDLRELPLGFQNGGLVPAASGGAPSTFTFNMALPPTRQQERKMVRQLGRAVGEMRRRGFPF